MIKTKWVLISVLLLAIGGAAIFVAPRLVPKPNRTVDEVIREIGPSAESKLNPAFEKAGLSYPPKQVALLAFKNEKNLEVWAKDQNSWIFVTSYPILAMSGGAGPKLRKGDRQVPEGIYRIEGLNPNSGYRFSLKLNYPNDVDKQHALADGRSDLGGDIFIHGKELSAGCLAMGDDVADQLFVLVARIGKENVQVIIAPRDFRRTGLSSNQTPSWLPDLYKNIDASLKEFVRPQ